MINQLKHFKEKVSERELIEVYAVCVYIVCVCGGGGGGRVGVGVGERQIKMYRQRQVVWGYIILLLASPLFHGTP